MSNIEQKVGIDRLADALSSLATKVKAIKSVDDLKNFASINEFNTQAQDGQLGTYEKDGHPVILLKYASVPHEFIDRELLEQYVNSQILLVKNDIEADDFEKLNKILDFTFGTNTTGGAISYVEHFGDLDDTTTRQNFMDNVKINNWYTFNIGGNPYQVVITSGDKTSNFQWVGKRVIDGPLGKTPEIVKGSTSTTGHAETSAGLTGEFFSNTLALPGAYSATQMLPKSTIEQMLIDNKTSNDFDEAYVLIANQVERKLTSSDSAMEWRHGETIKSTTVAAGHPISEGMTINYFDDYNNWIPVLYDEAKVQHAIFKYPERTIKVDIAVEKITNWDNAWTGAGTPTGTDKGWKITFSGPKLASDDSATTFPHNSNPLEMKLISVASSGNIQTVVDFPKDFLIKVDDLLGEQSENKEMWMQYNVADVLGNTWLSYTKGTNQNITLPSNKTIYDIEGVFGYSTNKQRWYNDYTGGHLPSRLSNLTLNNYDIFGADTKIIVELHRSDDQTTGTFTEYLNLELRPVIENGVINVNKINIKNKGIFTGGPGSNLKALVDTVVDGNKEIAQAAHIHFINIRFRGGK